MEGDGSQVRGAKHLVDQFDNASSILVSLHQPSLGDCSRSSFGDYAKACCSSVIGLIGHDKPTRDIVTRESTPWLVFDRETALFTVFSYSSYARYNLTLLASSFLILYPQTKWVCSPLRVLKKTENRPPVVKRTMFVVTPVYHDEDYIFRSFSASDSVSEASDDI